MLHETSSINHYQLRDRHDDNEHEQAVDPNFGSIYASQPCRYVRPHRAAHRQRYAQGPVHLTCVGEDQKALQADDEQNRGLHSISLPQVAACKQDQRGEYEETRAENDQTCIDADGKVSSRLAPAERTERYFFSLEPAARSDEK